MSGYPYSPQPTLDSDLRVPSLRRIHLGGFAVFFLLIADVGGLAIAWKMAEMLSLQDSAHYVRVWSLGPSIGMYWLAMVMQLVLSMAAGLYRYGDEWRDTSKQIRIVALVYLTVLLVTFMDRTADGLPRSLFAFAWVGSTVLIAINRWIACGVLSRLWKRGVAAVPVLLLAHPEEVESIHQGWQQRSGYRVAKVLTVPHRSRRDDRRKTSPDGSPADRSARRSAPSNHASTATTVRIGGLLSVLTPEGLCQLMEALGAKEIHVSESFYQRMSPAELWLLRGLGRVVRIVPNSLRPKHPSARSRGIGGVPTTEFAPSILSGVDFILKRAFDAVMATLLLSVFIPLFLAIAIGIKVDSPGPVLFKQERMGLGERPFSIYKFRTMVTDAEQLQHKLEEQNSSPDGILFKMERDPRITRAGQWLRRTSLDELPQILNVLRGEMSLVGPRPLPLRDVSRFESWHHARHRVLPGITGLWQVRGRSHVLDFNDAIALDLEYIQQWSLWLDIRLLWETLWVVVSMRGAY
ncbi:MAG: sugar transferase [Cyanobacteria bacterium J06597_1]